MRVTRRVFLILFSYSSEPAWSQEWDRSGLAVSSCASFASEVARVRQTPLEDNERADLVLTVRRESRLSVEGVMSRRFATSCLLLAADRNKESTRVLREILADTAHTSASASSLALSGLIWIEGDSALDDAALLAARPGNYGIYGKYHLQRLTFEEMPTVLDSGENQKKIQSLVRAAKQAANSWDARFWKYAASVHPDVPMLTDADKWRALPLLLSRSELPYKNNFVLSDEIVLTRRHLLAMHACDLVLCIVPDDTFSSLGGFPLGYPDKSFRVLFLSNEHSGPLGHRLLHHILESAAENNRISGKCEAWSK